jgi:hypothetical protein
LAAFAAGRSPHALPGIALHTREQNLEEIYKKVRDIVLSLLIGVVALTHAKKFFPHL